MLGKDARTSNKTLIMHTGHNETTGGCEQSLKLQENCLGVSMSGSTRSARLVTFKLAALYRYVFALRVSHPKHLLQKQSPPPRALHSSLDLWFFLTGRHFHCPA